MLNNFYENTKKIENLIPHKVLFRKNDVIINEWPLHSSGGGRRAGGSFQVSTYSRGLEALTTERLFLCVLRPVSLAGHDSLQEAVLRSSFNKCCQAKCCGCSLRLSQRH